MGVPGMKSLSIFIVILVAYTAAQTRTSQLYAPDTLYFTAQDIYNLSPQQNNTLFNVRMYYDFEMDKYWAGRLNDWSVTETTLPSRVGAGLKVNLTLNYRNPPIQFTFITDYWKQFLSADSCLGISGPLGPTGPLSSWGPIGNADWNPSSVISGDGSAWWQYWWKFFADWVGWGQKQVLGPQGPLGYTGPINKDQIYQVMYHLLHDVFLANDFNHNLDIHGVWGILGPLGPLGALGPLGPLGPIGAHGLKADAGGQYRNENGTVMRGLRNMWDSDQTISRVYELYEFYTRETATALAEENDSSFMVEADLANDTSVDTYRFTSGRQQTISVLVIPIIEKISDQSAHFGDFNVAVAAVRGKMTREIAVSALESSHTLPPTKQKGYPDYIVFRAAANTVYEVKIWARLTARSQHRYRVFVTGTGFLQGAINQEVDADLFNHMNFEGPYLHM